MQKSNGFRCFGFLIGQRQADLDAKSVRFVVFQRDCAVAAANDAINNGQTQACTCNATAGAVATFERAHQTIGLTHVKAGAFVAHRQDGSCLFTVDLHRKMQKIVFMEDGKAIVGTHEELLARSAAYRALYESQTGGDEHEA